MTASAKRDELLFNRDHRVLTHQVVRSVVDTINQLGIPLGIRRPKHDDLVEPVRRLELSNILSDPLQMLRLVRTLDQVIRPIFLIGRDKVRVVDGGQGLSHILHQREQLSLQVIVEHLGTGHGLVERHGGDIPAAEDEVVRVNHGQDVRERDVDVFSGLRVEPESQGGRADEGSNVVWLNGSRLGRPGDVVSVREDGRADGRSVVAADTDHHQADLGDLGIGLEFESLGDLFDGQSSTFKLCRSWSAHIAE